MAEAVRSECNKARPTEKAKATAKVTRSIQLPAPGGKGVKAKGVGASLGALLLAPRFGRQEKSERLPQGRVIVLRQPAAKGQLGGVQEWRRV